MRITATVQEIYLGKVVREGQITADDEDQFQVDIRAAEVALPDDHWLNVTDVEREKTDE